MSGFFGSPTDTPSWPPLQPPPDANPLAKYTDQLRALSDAHAGGWNPDNPVGTETTRAVPSVGNPAPGGFDPVVAVTPGGQPTTASDVAGVRSQLQAGSNVAMGTVLGMTGDAPGTNALRVYHGSPHEFAPVEENPLGAFDLSKVGTGEGAQAYGHGVYQAGNEDVARSYRDALTSTDTGFNELDTILRRFSGYGTAPSANDVREALTGTTTLGQLADNPDVINSIRKLVPQYDPSAAVTGDALNHYRTLNDAVESIAPKGHMYESELNIDPEHMLDWDKPLSQQSQHVQDAVASSPALTNAVKYGNKPSDPMGYQIYSALVNLGKSESFGENQVAAAQALKDAGIPATRYLDASSRRDPPHPNYISELSAEADRLRGQLDHPVLGPSAEISLEKIEKQLQDARDWEQGLTHNYVVHDPRTLNIIRRYGIAGLIAGGAGTALGADANASSPPTANQAPAADPLDFSARYNTKLTPAEEARYQAWGRQQAALNPQGRNPALDVYDYDMRGFWKSGGQFDAESGHGGDAFKKPNHPTFSTNSQYNGADGYQGGQWAGGTGGQPYTFTPSAHNLQMMSPADLQRYFAGPAEAPAGKRPRSVLVLPPEQ